MCVVTRQTKATGTQARLLQACPGLGSQGILFVPPGRWRLGREGPPASVPRGGAQLVLRHPPTRRRRRLGAGPPVPRPFPRFGPSPPARARTQASPGSMQMRYPGAGGPGRGEGGKGVVLVRAPQRAPGTCSLLLFCLLHTPTSRLAERSGLLRADPLLAAPAANVPAPLIGHRTGSARPLAG